MKGLLIGLIFAASLEAAAMSATAQTAEDAQAVKGNCIEHGYAGQGLNDCIAQTYSARAGTQTSPTALPGLPSGFKRFANPTVAKLVAQQLCEQNGYLASPPIMKVCVNDGIKVLMTRLADRPAAIQRLQIDMNPLIAQYNQIYIEQQQAQAAYENQQQQAAQVQEQANQAAQLQAEQEQQRLQKQQQAIELLGIYARMMQRPTPPPPAMDITTPRNVTINGQMMTCTTFAMDTVCN